MEAVRIGIAGGYDRNFTCVVNSVLVTRLNMFNTANDIFIEPGEDVGHRKFAFPKFIVSLVLLQSPHRIISQNFLEN